jgi:hypothetical protein
MKASVYNGDSVTYRIKVNDRIADKSRFPWGRSEMFYGGLTEDVIEDYGCFKYVKIWACRSSRKTLRTLIYECRNGKWFGYDGKEKFETTKEEIIRAHKPLL